MKCCVLERAAVIEHLQKVRIVLNNNALSHNQMLLIFAQHNVKAG